MRACQTCKYAKRQKLLTPVGFKQKLPQRIVKLKQLSLYKVVVRKDFVANTTRRKQMQDDISSELKDLEEAERVRRKLEKNECNKETGCSITWIKKKKEVWKNGLARMRGTLCKTTGWGHSAFMSSSASQNKWPPFSEEVSGRV